MDGGGTLGKHPQDVVEGSQASFTVGKSSDAQLGDRRFEPDGREHVLKIAATGMVIMHVTGDDHGHSRILGSSLPPVESPAIVVVVVQLGHSVCSIKKHVAPS